MEPMISRPNDARLSATLSSEPQEKGRSGSTSNYRGAVALNMLDRIGCGYLVVENHRKIVEANATARLILGCDEGAFQDLGQLTSAFKRLIGRAPNGPRLGPLSWIVISGTSDTPFLLNQVADDIPDGTSVVMLLDLDAHLRPNPFMLQRMFGLTMAETRLALQMAQGDLPADVASSRHLSRTTIRSQLAALFAKTNTKRQAELVTLLARVAVLP
ncbi:helix-turn-helix transcriptional regulator [Bosea sp. 2YAB26]|uniref:helix-turn-helix transcriptional regulator n=1 Tax=Bosea sp. 2YAB26 TaxID=3237478 RepID=UPI003F8E82B9